MIPDFGGLIWMVICIILVIVFISAALTFCFWIMPPIARTMIRAKWSKCSPCFIQDNMGRVHFIIDDTELPEGLFHNKRGWFITSTPLPHNKSVKTQKEKDKMTEALQAIKVLSKKEQQEIEDCEETVLETPILAGLGKTVFFGYDGAPLLSNIKTLAHANLKVMREILAKTDTKTRFGLLHRWSVQKGYEKAGKDTQKVIIIAICAIALVATVGIIAYLLLQGGA